MTRGMRIIIAVLILSFNLIVQGQEKVTYDVGASLFGFRQLEELPTYYFNVGGFFVRGKNYYSFPKGIVINRFKGNLHTSLELNYYKQKDVLDGSTCWDCPGGEGQLNGIETKIGTHRDYQHKALFFSYGLSAYYLHSRLKGRYGGGGWSEIRDVDNQFNHFGINPTLSLGIDAFKSIRISIETGAYFGRLFSENIDKRFANESFFSPIQSISVRYKMK
jgi:hypothetical protein